MEYIPCLVRSAGFGAGVYYPYHVACANVGARSYPRVEIREGDNRQLWGLRVTQTPQPPDLSIVSARPVQAWPASPARAPSPLVLDYVPRRAAVLDLLLILLAALVVPLGSNLVSRIWMPTAAEGELEPVDTGLLIIHEVFQAVLAAGLVAYLVLRNGVLPASFGLRLSEPGRQVLWAGAGLALTYVWLAITLVVVTFLMMLLPNLQEDLMKRRELIRLLPLDSLWRTVALMIPVAMNEEIVFRGLLLPYLRRVTGQWWLAVAIATGIFSVLHFPQGFIGVWQIMGVGLVLAVVFIYSRSLIATILAHFVFNVGQVLFMRWAHDWLREFGF